MDNKKYMWDMTVAENIGLGSLYSLLKLEPQGNELPEIKAGQFVQVEIKDSKTTYLRRPISVNFVDYDNNRLWLLVRKAGEGTRHLSECAEDETVNIIFPLGNGFTVSKDIKKPLLVGGGVGVAPLLYLGKKIKDMGCEPVFLLGARSKADLLMLEEFEKLGKVCVSTEDGSAGEKGLVTTNSILNNEFDMIYCCGPMPMMKAVAKIATEKSTDCEVSLENKMACGLGACLCCVEKKNDGHNVCVCTEGPVFKSTELSW